MLRVACTMSFAVVSNGRKIFWEGADCNDFLKRLEIVLGETYTPCYARPLMPNHFDINH